MLSRERFNEYLKDVKRKQEEPVYLTRFKGRYLGLVGTKYYRYKCKQCICFDRSHKRCDIDDSYVQPNRGICRLFYLYDI